MHKYYYTIIGFLLSHLLCAQAPFIVDGPALFTPAVPATITYTANTYVYRASTEIVLKAGWEVMQSGNTSTKYFLGYINNPIVAFYAELKETLDDSYVYAFNSKVCFKYDEKNAVSTNTPVTFVVYNAAYQQMSVPNNLVKNYGTNYLTLDLVGYNFVQSQYYIMEITNEKGEKRFLRFKYQV